MAEAVRERPKHKRKKKTKTIQTYKDEAIQPVIGSEKEESQIQPIKEPKVCLPEKDKNKAEINVDLEETSKNLQNGNENININIESEETGVSSSITESEEINKNVSSDEKTLDIVNEETNRNIDSGIGDIDINQIDNKVNNEALISQDTVDSLDNTFGVRYDSEMDTVPAEGNFENEEELLTISNNNNDVKIPSAPPPSIAYEAGNQAKCNTEDTATAPPVSIEHVSADVANLKENNTSHDQLDAISSPYAKSRPRLNAMVCKKNPLVKVKEAVVMEPFTDEQLNSFYFNHELGQLDFYIDEFLKNSQKIHSEFYDLVDSYYKSRLRLVDVQEKIKGIQETTHKERKEVWTISQCTYTAQGVCGCGVSVKQEHRYQQAKYETSKSKKLNTDLITLRGLIYETHQLQSYNSQTAKIRVESYLYKLFQTNAILKNLNAEQPISVLLPHELEPNTFPVLQHLQDCISALFSFKRLGSLEGEFSKDLQEWLDLLVAALQRVGTQPDSFFLLNHVLRCPQGMVSSLTHYIQFPSFGSQFSVSVTNKPQVHHFIVMLATLTLPVRSRKEFLAKCDKNRNIISNGGTNWTLLDEDKEEDENSEDSWYLMSEQDLRKVFDQFPFNDLLIAFLHIDVADGGILNHSPAKTLSHDVMHLFAFSSCLVKLLGQIFETYNMLRYRQFIKAISHTIRLVTQVVSDHWKSYREYRMDVIGDTYIGLPKTTDSSLPIYSLERLQIEFDQFFLRASQRILSSGSSGALQFLSTMPFEAVSSSSMWTLVHLIIDQKIELTSIMTSTQEDLPCVKKLDVSPSEGIFLLTALSNMAIARTESDKVFIETVAKLILEVSFLNSSLEDLYSKNGRDMLILIASKHNFLMTSLLNHASTQLEQLEKFLVFIFGSFPIHLWRPCALDMERIRTWLLQKPLLSEENRLARILLAKLNYGLDGDGVHLFLPRNFHFMIAILLVEAYGISFPDYAGGIKNLNYDQMGIMQQVGKIAVSSYTKIVYCQVHTTFISWAWEVILMLKLHESEAPKEESHGSSGQIEDSSVTWSEKMLARFKDKHSFELDLKETAELLNVHLAVQSKGLLAAYVAFAMTKDGHFVHQFLSNGLQYLIQLKNAALYDPVLRIVSNVARLCVGCPEKLYNESFTNTLMTLIHIDVNKAGYTEKLWQYFITGAYSQTLAALVTTHVIQAKNFSQQQAHKVIKYWIALFVKLPLWSRDCGTLYQIDCLCKVAFTITNGIGIICDVLYVEFQELIKTQQSRGLLSSVMSWISNNQAVSFMATPTCDFCYYAYAVLSIEMTYEQEIGFSVGLTTEMVMNPTMTVLQAYKKAASIIKSVYIPPINALPIYRWGEQAMITPNDHPFLPIIWQQFFQLYLQKPSESSGLPSRTGVGMRFFDEKITGSTTKKMKSTLYAVAKHHQHKSTAEEGTNSDDNVPVEPTKLEKEHVYTKEFHNTLSRFYQSLALWLEESRLHDANLFLSSLPEVYNPDLLLKIFQANKDLWYEFVDSITLVKELDALSSLWSNSVFRPTIVQRIDHIGNLVTEITAGNRITKRLNNKSKPEPPPSVVHPHSAVPEISFQVLLTQPRLIQNIGNDLQGMVVYAKTLSTLLATHIGLDSEFLEQLPDMYENVHRKLIVGIPCDGKKTVRVTEHCPDPAEVTLELTELQLHERIYNIVEENRQEFDELILKCCKPLADTLCNGVVHVENIIHKLSESFDSLNAVQQQCLQGSAQHLFYLLAQLIDGDVKRCHPAIQFFSSGVEKLGKKFIADNSSEQLSLLETILKQEQSVMFLAPYFTPMSAMNYFVQLYTAVVSFISEEHATTVFVLLSKFDLNIWLSTFPFLSHKTTMATLVMKAMVQIGPKPNSESLVILETIRGHMLILLNSDINEFFYKMLLEFLNASATSSIATICWDDFMSCLGYDNEELSDLLYVGQVKESIQFLASYFANILDNCNYQLEVLYEQWEPYINPFNQLLSGLFRQLIHDAASQVTRHNKEDLLRETWEHIISVYQAWLVPRSSGKIWSLLRMDSIMCLIQSFTEAIRLVVNLFAMEGGYCVILNYVWTYYFQSIVQSVKEEQSLEMFHSLFATLPWVFYCPTVQELSFVLQSYDSYPSAFRFYGSLLSDIDWPAVVKSYLASGNVETISRLHQQLFHILVMMAANKVILQKFSSKLTYLFRTAKTFQWKLIGLEETGRACKWYAENVEPSLILQRESFVYSTLDLFLHVCGYSADEENIVDEVTISRRNLYVQTVVTILARCSSLKDRVYEFRYVMEKLLNTVESTFKYNKINPLQELVMHASSTLNLLNTITTLPIYEAVMATIESHLLSTGCGMMVLAFVSATSMSVANLEQMVSLLEKAISCHFMRLSDGELHHSWTPVINAFVVPELEADDFVNEALKQKAILTLYAYNVHRITKSETRGQQLSVLFDIVQWCTKSQPDKETESKLLLFWLQIFNVIRIQTPKYKSRSEFQQLAKYMVYFSSACQAQGEDKSYDGVLGMIGIGRKSHLSKEFRVTAKAVHLFLLCQLPSSGLPLRASPNAPGAIRNSIDVSARATTEAEKFFSIFQGFLKNKSYATMHTHIKWIVEFLSSPLTNINDGCTLVAYLCKAFFEKENFIAASVT